jgi:hypothetical protein
MRDSFLLTALIVVGAGGVYLWWSKGDALRPFDSLKQEATAASEPAKAPAAPPVIPAATPAKRIRSHASEPVKVEPVAVVEPPAPEPAPVVEEKPAPPPKPVFPFPAVEQIQAGVPKETITETYGTPSVSTLTSSRGSVIENWVYTGDSGKPATIVRIQDGKVLAAYSKQEPPPVAGLSVPRPKPAE